MSVGTRSCTPFLYTTLVASLIAQHFIKAIAKPSAFGFKEGLCISVVMIAFYGLPRLTARNDKEKGRNGEVRGMDCFVADAPRNDKGGGIFLFMVEQFGVRLDVLIWEIES